VKALAHSTERLLTSLWTRDQRAFILFIWLTVFKTTITYAYSLLLNLAMESVNGLAIGSTDVHVNSLEPNAKQLLR
jgi:hypothetical protein